MGMQDLLKAFELINKKIPDQKDFNGEKSENLLCMAEEALDIKFPPTYRYFLKNHGCGGIDGFEVYGLIDERFAPLYSSDTVGITLDARKQYNLPKEFIIISDTGDGYWYALDSSYPNKDGEYPVVICGLGAREKVNEDFGEFFLENVTNLLSDDE